MTVHHVIVPSNPTPNGDIHIGHIAGPFIGADALRRGALQREESACVLLGTAWQNTHVMLAAQRRDRPYLEYAASIAAEIEASFESVRIGYDVMLHHEDIPDIEEATRTAYRRLREAGFLHVRETAAQYCPAPGCDAWRFQGFISGICPHCGSPDASDISCEGCGLFHDDSELISPECAVCNGATQVRSLLRAFIDLEPMRGWFEDLFSRTVMGPGVHSFARDVLSRPLPSVAVTFPGELGIAAQDPELPGQMIYPAFELSPRYTVMAQRYWADTHELPVRRTTMLFGFDNAFERIFLFPAVHQVLVGYQAPMPEVMQSSYFYLLEGSKFSTSRNHLIGVRDLVREAGADAVRLYLSATRPEQGPSNFSRQAFLASAEMAAVLRLRQWAETGSVPGDIVADSRRELTEAMSVLHEALTPENLSCARASSAVLRLTGLAGASGEGSDLQTAVLYALVNGASALIPDTADLLRKAFSVPQTVFDGRLPEGMRLGRG